MKKCLALTVFALIITASFIGCKKDDAFAPAKDYSASIKDKTYWGTLTNAGEGPQYYSVHFNSDNTLLWSQFSGDYPGKFTIEKNKLTMTFLNPSVIVTADIADDNKLTNITTNTANKVNSGDLVGNPNIPLDGAVWTGSFVNLPAIIELSFLTGSKVQTTFSSTTYASGSYFRSASGGVIRFNVPFLSHPIFCVITSSGTMNGSYNLSTNTWQAIKR